MAYTTEYMDSLRQRSDTLADDVVRSLFESGEVGKFNTLMRWFTTSGQPLPPGLPDAAREYLESTSTPPDWVDWDTMELARQFFIDNNAHISTALAFAAMPAGYAVPPLAKLLSCTHGLAYPSRRMAETGQLTTYMMQPDSFEAGGKFIPAAQKVRLMHAAIRHHLRRQNLWDEETWGMPICLEDMIGSQMCFSIFVLDALHRMHIRMSPEGAEAYYYAWKVVAAMLGVDVDDMPADTTAGREFSDLYFIRHMAPTPEAAHLTKQLIDLYQEVVPGTFADPVVPALIRFLVGETVADWLEVPRSPWDAVATVVPAMLNVLERIEDASPYGNWLLDRAQRAVVSLELNSLTRGRVMHYSIPTQLKKDFGMSSMNARRWTPPPLTLP
ncbi:oxygenase MpaB family protein [Spirillospora sp. NPDC048911]|uniref:oxygenase MpaB family protein n=1 Tax=Spirillospora sp. NPDC048911 TaxID=3364527 RepID=UPI0037233E92